MYLYKNLLVCVYVYAQILKYTLKTRDHSCRGS